MFHEIAKDMIQLQRNILVFSYTGYKGVLKKIDYIEKEAEEKFQIFESTLDHDNEFYSRYSRMHNHYLDYKEGFNEVIEYHNTIKDLNENQLAPLAEKANLQLDTLVEELEANENFKASFIAAKIKTNLTKVISNIIIFKTSPDIRFIEETELLLTSIQKDSFNLKNTLLKKSQKEYVDEIISLLEQYNDVFVKLITSNRTYLALVNVVLAGKAAEISRLSLELDEQANKRSSKIQGNTHEVIKKSQLEYLAYTTIAACIAIFLVLLTSNNISSSVKSMAYTLSSLAKKQSNITIPSQNRPNEIGQMAKAANEFKNMAEELKHQTNELEEFAYRTSHDLRSPIVSSIKLIEIIKNSLNNNDDEKVEQSLNIMERSLIKLEVLVRDILDLTKTKNLNEDVTNIDIGNIVDDALNKFSNMENYGRLKISKSLEFNEELISQKSRVSLIVENLISNAIKYQDSKKNSSYINISSCRKNNKFVFRVEDNGLGIPEEQQNKLFSMFKRFHPKVSYGSGLGLYMMSKSAQILNGSIQYKATSDGSIFTFKMPII